MAREDLHLLHRALPQWSLVAAFGSLADWHEGEELPGGAHDIWCKGAHGFFEFQLMVSEFTAPSGSSAGITACADREPR